MTKPKKPIKVTPPPAWMVKRMEASSKERPPSLAFAQKQGKMGKPLTLKDCENL